jgi:hypothetical protein
MDSDGICYNLTDSKNVFKNIFRNVDKMDKKWTKNRLKMDRK